MNIDDIYKSNSTFLKAQDLSGGKPIVEIENAEVRENEYNGETRTQVVLSFVDKEKVLGLNVTNARRIAALFGTNEIADWVGGRIRLYVDQTQLADGRTVDCIRIFPDLPEQTNPKVKAATAGLASAEDESIPF
jgi:hypothetical protein